MQSTGQTSTQAVSLVSMQGSVMTNGMQSPSVCVRPETHAADPTVSRPGRASVKKARKTGGTNVVTGRGWLATRVIPSVPQEHDRHARTLASDRRHDL